MTLGFKKRFVPLIESGQKTHTIRKGRRWRVGMKAHLYASPRTKQMRLLFVSEVVRVDEIEIYCDYAHFQVRVNDALLTEKGKSELARKDGFTSPDEMHKWFFSVYGISQITGQVIHWKPQEVVE